MTSGGTPMGFHVANLGKVLVAAGVLGIASPGDSAARTLVDSSAVARDDRMDDIVHTTVLADDPTAQALGIYSYEIALEQAKSRITIAVLDEDGSALLHVRAVAPSLVKESAGVHSATVEISSGDVELRAKMIAPLVGDTWSVEATGDQWLADLTVENETVESAAVEGALNPEEAYILQAGVIALADLVGNDGNPIPASECYSCLAWVAAAGVASAGCASLNPLACVAAAAALKKVKDCKGKCSTK